MIKTLDLYPVYMTSGTALENLLSATGKGEDYRTVSDTKLDIGTIAFDNKLQSLSKACVVKLASYMLDARHSTGIVITGVRLYFNPINITSYYTSGSSITVNAYQNYGPETLVHAASTSYERFSETILMNANDKTLIGFNNLLGLKIHATRESGFFSTEAWMRNLYARVSYEANYFATFYGENGEQIGATQTVEGGKRPFSPAAPEKKGFEFLGWSNKGTVYSGELPSSEDTDLSFTAVYRKIPIVKGIITEGLGTAIDRDYQVPYGEPMTCYFTPKSEYYVKDVIIDGVSQGEISSYTFESVTSDHTVETKFSRYCVIRINPCKNGLIQYKLSSEGVIVTVPPDGVTLRLKEPTKHESFIIYAFPDEGYEINSFTRAFTNYKSDYSAVFTLQSGESIAILDYFDHEYSVDFKKILLDVDRENDGNGVIEGPNSVEYGDNAQYTITPNDHYIIKDILLDGVSVLSQVTFTDTVARYNLQNITANHTISAVFQRVVYVTFEAGENGNISGETVINYGDNAFYSVTADEGYSIDKIYVNNELYHQVTLIEDLRTVYQFALTEDITIRATFTDDIVSLTTVQPDKGGYISGSANGNYVSGSMVTLYAVSNEGWYLSSWFNGEKSEILTFDITESTKVTAVFEAYSCKIIAVGESNGSVDPAQVDAKYDDVKVFKAVPAPGYAFSHWEDGSTEIERRYVVDGNATLTAHFVKDYFEIKTHGEGGTVTVEGEVSRDGKFEFESEVKLVATPDEGYYFVMWEKEVAATPEITVVVPAGGDEYVAVFKKYKFRVDIQHGVGAESVTESRTVEYGDDLTIEVKSAIGYKLVDIVVNGESVFEYATVTIDGGRYLLSNIRADQKVVISFEERRYNFGRKLIDYYPPVIQRIADFIELTNIQQPLVGRVWDSVSFAYENQFIDDATEEGIIEWEKDYGIVPAKNDSLKQRKQRLKAMWVPSPRYTYEWLVKWLKVACDDENIIPPLVEDYSLKTYLPSGVNYFEILDNMRRYVPANMHISPVVKLNVTEQNLYTGTAFRLKIKETLTIEREEVQNET